MTKRWWEFLLSPLVTPGGIALSESEKAEALSDTLETVSADYCPRRYWDGWRSAEVLVSDACQRNQVHQPWQGSRNYQESQRRQGSWPKILGKLLRDYAEGNSCLIFEPDNPTINPYNPLATPDALSIVITKKLTSPVHLTSCSALISDHLPVVTDTTCLSSFQHPRDRPDFGRTDWAKFQTHLEDQITFGPELHVWIGIDTCVENFFGDVLKALEAFTHKRRPRTDPRPPITAGIQNEIA